MYRQIVWVYVFVLTLLEISLNTKLTAQGKSHGVIHDTLIEGITFQEWGGDGTSDGGGGGGGGGATANGAAETSLRLEPPALDFGSVGLGEAHARRVMLTNTGNATLHLASLSGTTPDFHASFFDAKTLPPAANTSFSVVYLGRREGAVLAHLYIHTSLGVHKYAVSAWGAASEYRVWPVLGLRLPHNASAEAYSPLLSIHNPTPRTLQVSEVYSSARWAALELPADGASAALWAVPPHESRALVRLRLDRRLLRHPRAPQHAADRAAAYIRIKVEGAPSPLVVCVEVSSGSAGSVYAAPHVLYYHLKGTRDPPTQVEVLAANGGASAVPVSASAGVACGEAGAEAGAGAALVTPRREELPPHGPLAPAATLTLDWARMAAAAEAECAGAAAGACWVWCRGEVRVNAQAVAVRARLAPGTLALRPAALRVATGARGAATAARDLRATNEFATPLHLTRLEVHPDVDEYFTRSEFSARSLEPGASCVLTTLRLRTYEPDLTLSSWIRVHTNVSVYDVPVLLYSGKLHFEWEWPVPGAGDGEEGSLNAGVMAPSSTLRVRGWVRNPGPERLCLAELAAHLEPDTAAAALHYLPCAAPAAAPAPGDAPPDYAHECWCLEGGGRGGAWLTLVAPAREGAAAGWLVARTAHAATRARLSLAAARGRLRARPVRLQHCAPYCPCSAALVVESSLGDAMTLVALRPHPPHPALSHVAPPSAEELEIRPGVNAVGGVTFSPEVLCAPDCYTGLDLDGPEGREWVRLAEAAEPVEEEALAHEAELLRARRRAFRNLTGDDPLRYTMLLHTTQVVMSEVEVTASLRWPRLVEGAPAGAGAGGARGPGWAGLAGVGAPTALRLRLRNPSHDRPLLLHPVLGPVLHTEHMSKEEDMAELSALEFCLRRSCVLSPESFAFRAWRAASGGVREWRRGGGAGDGEAPALLLAPRAWVSLEFVFTPPEPAFLAAPLYLRNNLTILEVVHLTGQGARPSFKFGNRRPGSGAPLLFDLTDKHLKDCERGAEPSADPNLTVKRSFTARNTGRIPIAFSAFYVESDPCEGYGFKVLNCEPFTLPPNATHKVEVAFTPDFTLSRVRRTLTLATSVGEPTNYSLVATVPADLLPPCAAAQPRPPWERHLRNASVSLCICIGLAVLAAAALDSDRILKRALAAMTREHRHAPLDLRALNHTRPRAAHWAEAWPPAAAPPAPLAPERRRRWPEEPQPCDPPARNKRRAPRRPTAEGAQPDRDERKDGSASPDRGLAPAAPAPAAAGDSPRRSRSPTPARRERDAADDERAPLCDDEDDSSTGTESSNVDEHDKEAAAPGADGAPRERTDPDRDRPKSPPRRRPKRERATPTPPRPERPRAAPAPPPAPPAPADAPRPDAAEAAHRPRPPTNKFHAKKEKPGKKRAERAHAPPARAEPPPAAEARGSPPANALRRGTTFSEVVARSDSLYAAPRAPEPRPLAPIGSALRRRSPAAAPAPAERAYAPRRADADGDSLFFFNGAGEAAAVSAATAAAAAAAAAAREVGVIGPPPPDAEEYAPAAAPPPAAQPGFGERCAPPVYAGEAPTPALGGGYGGLGGSLWGVGGVGRVGGVSGPGAGAGGGEEPSAAARWLWGGYGIKPPPGFPQHPPQVQPVRAFDPFQSLSSIWSPGARDWRPRERDERP